MCNGAVRKVDCSTGHYVYSVSEACQFGRRAGGICQPAMQRARDGGKQHKQPPNTFKAGLCCPNRSVIMRKDQGQDPAKTYHRHCDGVYYNMYGHAY